MESFSVMFLVWARVPLSIPKSSETACTFSVENSNIIDMFYSSTSWQADSGGGFTDHLISERKTDTVRVRFFVCARLAVRC